jgi:hypothetical protein
VRFADALQVLGIDAQTDRKSARRVYLRLVRVHRPEQDPEGFQRIRTAWETVEPLLPARSKRRAAAPPEAPTPSKLEAAPGETRRFDSPPTDADVDAHRRPSEESEALPEPAVWTASEPDPVAALDAWVLRDEPEPAAAPIPRQPVWTGASPAQRARSALDVAEVDAEGALDAVRTACADALAGRRPEPALADLLRAVLLLHRSGAAHEANAAWAAVQDWTSGAGVGLRVGNTVSIWLALARELSDLPPHFPTEVRRTLASAALDHHPAHARQVLRELYRDRPHTALDAADLLEAHAPNLFGMFGTALRAPIGTPADHGMPPPRSEPRDDVRDRWSLGWAILLGIAITALFRLCAEDARRPPPMAFEPVPFPMPVFEPIEPVEIPPLDLWRTALPPSVYVEICLSDAPTDRSRCATMRAIDVALAFGDCDDAARLREALVNGDGSLDTTVAEPVPSTLLALVDDRIRACQMQPSPPPEPGAPP